jgi:hypothetical protein
MFDLDTTSAWENKTLDYNLEKYPWNKWVLDIINEIRPDVKSLETIHEVVDVPELVKIQAYVQAAFGRKEFMQRFDSFAEEYAKNLISNKKYLIKRNATLNVVLPNQAKKARRLPFHQGIFYSNGRGQRTIWMALTKCEGTNSMWIMDTDNSQRITKTVIAEQWPLSKFEEECVKYSKPVEIIPGQAHLFHQEHIHGNVNNETGYTRMSIDWHILIEGEEYWRRQPGGFFRLPGDYAQDTPLDYTGKVVVAYTSNNTEFDSNIPMYIQRGTVDSYCAKHKINHTGVQFENEFLPWLPILQDYIFQKPDAIVLFSLHSLPDDAIIANKILNLALQNEVELHFANEFLSLKDRNDLEKILTYKNFGVKKKGPFSWE